jgi:hypothetical protein
MCIGIKAKKPVDNNITHYISIVRREVSFVSKKKKKRPEGDRSAAQASRNQSSQNSPGTQQVH